MLPHLINIFSVFLLAVATIFVPVLGLGYFNRQYRNRLLHYLPLGAALMFLFLHTTSAVFYKVVDFGWLKFLLVVGLATIAVQFLLKLHTNVLAIQHQQDDKRALGIIFILALLAISDNFYVLAREGYFNGDMPYLRLAFVSDMTRNLILTNALVREDGSPFMPWSEHNYQMFWFHGAALFSSLFSAEDKLGLVYGYSLSTAYLFYVVLFWALYALRPSLFLSFRFLVIIVLIMLPHAEIYNMVKSYLKDGLVLIAADGGYTGKSAYSDYDIRAAVLTSPQHVSYLIFFIIYFAITTVYQTSIRLYALCYSGIIIVAAFIASPILWLLSFPLYFISRVALWAVRQVPWQNILKGALMLGVILVACYLSYVILMRASPIDQILRPAVGVSYPVEQVYGDLIRLPVILIKILGPLGFYIVALFILNLIYRQPLNIIGIYFFLLLAVLVFNILAITPNMELKRHTNIILGIAAILYAVSVTPDSRFLRRASYTAVIVFCATLGIIGQAYYVHAFTHKPSVLAADVDWSDYFCVNRAIETRYPKTPTLAAWKGSGLRFPLVMHVTSSFSGPEEAYVYSKLSGEALAVLDKAVEGAKPYAIAKDLGLKLMVWGPNEKRIWGAAQELIDQLGGPVATCGSVSLYRL